MKRTASPAVDPQKLPLAQLALFVGLRANELVMAQLHAAGFKTVRQGHGYLFQHLLGGPRTVGELAELLGVSQQAASKSVAELEKLDLVEKAIGEDARVRRVQLSARGMAAVEKARAAHAALERKLEKAHGPRAVASARTLLAEILEAWGGAEAVRNRRIRAPR